MDRRPGVGGGMREEEALSREMRPPPADALSDAVREAQQGDEAAFRVLYRTVQPRLIRYLRVLVGDDADDVASESWLQIVRDLRTFRGDGDGFRAWTATIARHRAMDHLRRRHRHSDVLTHLDACPDNPGREDTAGAALETLGTDAALALIAELPRDQAEAVLLRVVIGLDAERAAQVLGKRAGAVRTAAYRGLRRLKQRLGMATTESEALSTASGPPAGTSRPVGVTRTAATTLKKLR